MSEEITVPVAELKPAKAEKKNKPAKAKKEQAKKASGAKILRPQARILAALAAKGPMIKERLSKASGVHMNWIAEYVGTADKSTMVSDEVRGAKKLACAGLVKVDVMGDEVAGGERSYGITASGRKALERLQKAEANGK